MSIFKGSGVAIITPFNENGIDFEKFRELLEWHIKESTDAIIVCGTTGEATTMTEKEKKQVANIEEHWGEIASSRECQLTDEDLQILKDFIKDL